MEDRNLVAGYISLFNNNFEKAQKLFLESSEPVAALEVSNSHLMMMML